MTTKTDAKKVAEEAAKQKIEQDRNNILKDVHSGGSYTIQDGKAVRKDENPSSKVKE